MIFLNILSWVLILNLVHGKNSCTNGPSNCVECGLSYSKRNVLRIIGGAEAEPHSWPSMAFIQFKYIFYYTYKGRYFTITHTSLFGGTVISSNTILTAAHCIVKSVKILDDVIKVEPNTFYASVEAMYTVYLGLHKISDIDSGKSYKHPNYNETDNFLHDIALIKLENNIDFDEKIQPACLPDKNFGRNIKEGTRLVAAGWGVVEMNQAMPDGLQNVELRSFANKRCQNIKNNKICAGNDKDLKNTCQGDSGGPLYAIRNVNKGRRHVVVGITSYGYGCFSKLPSVYTKTYSYLDWIKKNSGLNIKKKS
ncbi:unnamed protein product [Brachionus calyciflorus]|uniref:Peptidase S1 domain-containing protein n=1 Tax=Brachionus calyciflorus TaxID=104777 RepID=A0A814BXR5_9BILA|nr:unnamed protein product [Brachionus calyciflorus]